MLRHARMVNAGDWRLSEILGDRCTRLIEVPSPEALMERVITESAAAAKASSVSLRWQESLDRPGYARLVAQTPLSEITFDQFFNGRSGYRAQYYLSPEEGILFNRALVDRLIPVVGTAYDKQPLPQDWALIRHSLEAPHAKVWVFREQEAFDEVAADTVNPQRWVDNVATRGRKAPLPKHLMLDLKGAFIRADTKELFIDDLKLDRAWDLFNRGST